MLRIEGLYVSYGEALALEDVSITIEEGACVAIVGANGAGKTTLVNTIAGILRPRRGHIWLENHDLTAIPAHAICTYGVALVPEGRRLFNRMSVLDNLRMGGYATGTRKEAFQSALEWVFELFPVLYERRHQRAGTLSGGQQQMVAIGRALLANPRLLLLDEPSLGLAPIVVRHIFQAIRRINRELGATVLIVEQNVVRALELATAAYVLAEGRIVHQGAPEELIRDPLVRQAYLGPVSEPRI